MEKVKFTLTLGIVGPMKRSTLSHDPDPIMECTRDLLHWSCSVRLQARRLRSSLRAELRAWGYNPGVVMGRRFSATSYDEHMLVVAGANLHRAIRRAKKPVRQLIQISEMTQKALWLLRHNYEHWDELRRQYQSGSGQLTGAAAKLKEEFPQADPWTLTYNPVSGEVVLADVVPLAPLLTELSALEKALVRFRKRQGARVSR